MRYIEVNLYIRVCLIFASMVVEKVEFNEHNVSADYPINYADIKVIWHLIVLQMGMLQKDVRETSLSPVAGVWV